MYTNLDNILFKKGRQLVSTMSNIRCTITRYILEYLFGNADVQEASGHHHHAANRARRQVQSVQYVLSKKSRNLCWA